ncbi:MAG: zf-HC2 domain-containing protein [Armatimonadota bacterium]|nr:zf-HC2 domain-containing protein [Armatimonadota bacterium]MDR5696849.1 zf-HC2 domain-containing protein [Armatimonadota bacterium]
MNRRLERLISAYLDDEVSAAERREVEALLRTREDVRQLHDELLRVRTLLRSLPDRPVPEGLEEEILKQVRPLVLPQPSALGSRLRGWLSAWARRPALALVAVAVMAVVLLLPVVRGELGRLRASEVGIHFFVREHAVHTSTDPLSDRAYLGVVLTDTNLALAGEWSRPDDEEGGKR